MKKLIIFDCDGVLVDSEMIAQRVGVEALAHINYSITTEESLKRFTGLSGINVRKIIFEESGIDLPEDFFSKTCQPQILKAFEIELKPLLQEVLCALHQQNISRCVASSSPRERVVRALEITGQKRFFTDETIFTAQQVQKGKPAPDLFLFAAKQMGCLPKDCLVIEDSPADIEAALAANMHVIGFLGGTHAHYGWYQEKINHYQIPVAYSTHELRDLLISRKNEAA